MKPARFSRHGILTTAIASLLAAGVAQGADYYWTANGASGTLGGSGDWHTPGTWAQKDVDGTTWLDPVGDWNNDGTALALFTNASGTITMNEDVYAQGILLNVGQTIEGSGTLTIGVDGVSLSISNAHIATNIIGENLVFTITNSTLTLSGDNTDVIGESTVQFSSTTKTMQLASANALGTAIVTLSGAGGILNLGNDSAENISYNASELNMGSSTSLIAANKGVSTWTGTVTPTGTGTVLGTIENATAQLVVNGDVSLGTRAIIAATSNSSLGIEINGIISGSGSITTSGTRRLALGGINTFTGALNLAQNTAQLALTNVDALKAATLDTKTSGTQTVTFEVAGTNTYNIGALTGGDGLAIGANTLSIGAKNSATTYTGIMSGTGGGLTKVGSDTLTLTNANTYDGLTSIKYGTLFLTTGNDRLNTAGSMVIGDTSTAGKLVLGTTTLAVNQTLAGLTATGSKGYVVGANATTNSVLTLNIGSGTNTYSGILGGTGTNENKLALTKTGSGTLALGDVNTYAGVTTITTGTLSVGTLADGGSTSSIGSSLSAAANLVFDGGTLQYTGGNVSTNRGFTLNDSKVGTIDVSTSTSKLTISGASATTGGGLTKTGSGTLELTGANTYSGVTTIAAGTLSVGTLAAGGSTSSIGNSLSAAANLVFDGGTLKYTGDTVSTNRGFTLNDTKVGTIEVTTGASTLTFTGASATTSGGLTKTGSGILELTGANTYSGGTIVRGGTLAVNNASGSSGTGSGNVTVETGATLMGSGYLAGTTTIQGGGIHAPGNSPGIETFAALTYDNLSIFKWDLAANKDTNGLDDNILLTTDNGVRGTDYDGTTVTGALSINSGTIFKVIKNAGVNFADTFWTKNQVWSNIFSYGTLTGGWTAGTAVSVFDTSDVPVSVSAYGHFSTSGATLNWTTIPEPSSALAGLLLGAGLLRRRR